MVDRAVFIWKPRVSYCRMTNKWIANRNGWRHHCGPVSAPGDEAFRHWEDALQAANRIGKMRLQQEADRLRRARELDG